MWRAIKSWGWLPLALATLAQPALSSDDSIEQQRERRDRAEQQTKKALQKEEEGVIRFSQGVGGGIGAPDILSDVGRVGANINKILEVGVEGSVSQPNLFGAALYLKVPADENWYAIGHLGNTGVWGRHPSYPTSLDAYSIGIGRRLKPGLAIEGRVGKRKSGYSGACRTGLGGCVPGNTDSTTGISINVIRAF
jgi:hypothetical protein